MKGFLESRSLNNETCYELGVKEFPNMLREKNTLNAVVCCLLSIYLFVVLSVVCDNYLVPAMERLCYALRMSYDVAGATFMAAATSAPELFVNFVGTFVTHGDMGIGTIVGSSMFNVLGIPIVCGLMTGIEAELDWWPMTRDSMWYMISILALAIVMCDSTVSLLEAAGLLSGYVIYLIAMTFDREIQSLFRDESLHPDPSREDPMLRDDEPLKTFYENITDVPCKEDSMLMRIYRTISYPAVFLLAITTPSVRFCYVGTLIVSVAWICMVSYLVSWFLTIIGYIAGIPDSIMGLTVLAVGTSVPEAVSSFIVTRKGYGSMAMCNAIGSNTFDIFICLGLPWTLDLIFQSSIIEISSAGMFISVTLLLISGIMLYSCFLWTNFVLGPKIGWMSLVSYVLFVTICCTLEFLNLKEPCKI